MSETMTYRMSDQVEKLFEALGNAQAVMAGAKKDSTNPHFQSKYADLAAVWDACRGPLAAQGLSVIQLPSADGPRVTISTILAHKTGQWIASDLTLTSVKADPQGIGSAITYGRRYGLSAMVGISPEDDDGNAASHGKEKPEPSRKPQPTPITAKPAPAMLNAIKGMKAEIGDALYYECLGRHDIHNFGDIQTADQATALLDELGKIRMSVVASTHGEGAGLTEALFNSLPEANRGKVMVEMVKKIAEATGSADTAKEEYERLRAGSGSQWELYTKLDKCHEFYVTGKASA